MHVQDICMCRTEACTGIAGQMLVQDICMGKTEACA